MEADIRKPRINYSPILGIVMLLLVGAAIWQTVVDERRKDTEAFQRQEAAAQAKEKLRAVKTKLDNDDKELERTCEGRWNDACVQPLAEKGNVAAQSTFGSHLYGMHNYEAAIPWLERAAKQGDVLSMTELASVYSRGIIYQTGPLHDLLDAKKAIAWNLKAAEAGDSRAMRELAGVYEYGQLATRDYQEAAKWYAKAAEAGERSGPAISSGDLYRDGRIGKPDKVEAYKWYSIACVDDAAIPDAASRACGNRDKLENKMSSADILKAQQLASEWMKQFRK